jgi:STE24 endopeptidase
MTSTTLFYIIISIIIINFIIEKILDFLNAQQYNDALPKEVSDVYNQEEYLKSQAYKKVNFKLSTITSLFSLITTLLFFILNGFEFVDQIARTLCTNNIIIALLFFGIIFFSSDIISTPFSYYKTFTIEEKFGFNKSTKKLFWLDKIKGWAMMIVIGGLVLSLIIWFYEFTGDLFWIYAWGFVALFTLFMNLFYSTLIVPLFNKQTPLKDGDLKTEIKKFTNKVGFKLDSIFVIDGSKRSTKANAYFSGFGATKRIVLFDTLINDLSTQEIVAVLAHEVGHYKRKHTVFNLIASIVLTGFTFYLLSLFIGNNLLSQALEVSEPSFHIGLIAFGILYSPISQLTSLIMNMISRKFEYQADNYAKEYYGSKPLVSSLKKLSKNSLSNLTPHKAYVFMHYSHPTLRERILNLNK